MGITDNTFDKLQRAAKQLGAERGRVAGEVCLVTRAELPVCDFSGEWADTPSPRDVMEDIILLAHRIEGGNEFLLLESQDVEEDAELFHELTEDFRQAYNESAVEVYSPEPPELSNELPQPTMSDDGSPKRNL